VSTDVRQAMFALVDEDRLLRWSDDLLRRAQAGEEIAPGITAAQIIEEANKPPIGRPATPASPPGQWPPPEPVRVHYELVEVMRALERVGIAYFVVNRGQPYRPKHRGGIPLEELQR
jgi:hypothetical protein